jgi:FkbM family methyltransferase
MRALLLGPSDPVCDSGTVRIGSFGGFEVAYRQGTADELVLKESFDHDLFFAGVPEYRPNERDVIVDVGAHIGTFALLAASKVPRGAVYAIEASEETFNLLRINAALNRMTNLSTHHLALSNGPGTCTLYHSPANWGHSVVCRRSDRSETVECRTLQQFFEDSRITRCDFLKFNCEGSEFPILLSSSADLLRRLRMMLVLYHCDLWTSNSEDDLLSHLRASGFDCSVRNRTDKRGWIVAVNPAPSES